MKSLKLRFVDFWPGFDPGKNLFVEVLRKHFEVEDSADPDFLVYSNFGFSHLDYDVPRVFFTSENLRPDFNICDYAFGYDRLSFGDRYYRFPIYLFQRQDWLHGIGKRILAPGARKFCSFVYSNPGAGPERDEFFHMLSRYKPIDSAGKHLNNTGFRVKDKAAFQRGYKFSIAFENSSTPGYTTEKIVDAYCSGTVPIYWGDLEIAQDFNPESFVNCHDYPRFEKVVERVASIDQNDEEYARMYEAPFLRRPMQGYSLEPGFEDFLFHIFDQQKERAFRRNRQFWGKAYETQRRKFASYITRMEKRKWFRLTEHLQMLGLSGTVRKVAEKLRARKRERKGERLRNV